ncbi:MAG: phage head-tail connector protein [Pseudomonadota bacterium]
MTNLTVLTPPAEAAVPVSKAKAFLRIGHDGEDDLVSDLIDQATARVEQASGLALVSRVLQVEWLHWPPDIGGRGARLPVGPVRALQAVRVYDEQRTVSDETARFRLVSFPLEGGRLALQPWSMVPGIEPGGAAQVVFEAGFGGAGDVPADLVEAVLLTAAARYGARSPGAFDFEGGEDGLPADVQAILNRRRGIRL